MTIIWLSAQLWGIILWSWGIIVNLLFLLKIYSVYVRNVLLKFTTFCSLDVLVTATCGCRHIKLYGILGNASFPWNFDKSIWTTFLVLKLLLLFILFLTAFHYTHFYCLLKRDILINLYIYIYKSFNIRITFQHIM